MFLLIHETFYNVLFLDSLSTLNNASAPSYQSGFHFEGTNITKSQLDSFVISTSNGNTVNVFQNHDEQPYRKIVVNGDGGGE